MYAVQQALIAHLQQSTLLDTVKEHEGEVPRAVQQQNPSLLTTVMPAAFVMVESGSLGNRRAPRTYSCSAFLAVRTTAHDYQDSQKRGLQIVQEVAAYLDEQRRWNYDGETYEVSTKGAAGSPITLDLLVVHGDYTVVEVACSVEWY